MRTKYIVESMSAQKRREIRASSKFGMLDPAPAPSPLLPRFLPAVAALLRRLGLIAPPAPGPQPVPEPQPVLRTPASAELIPFPPRAPSTSGRPSIRRTPSRVA